MNGLWYSHCTDYIAFSTKRLKEIDLESPPVSVAEPPRTMEGEGLDSSMEEGLTSLPPAAEAAAAAAAFTAACEYPIHNGTNQIFNWSQKQQF